MAVGMADPSRIAVRMRAKSQPSCSAMVGITCARRRGAREARARDAALARVPTHARMKRYLRIEASMHARMVACIHSRIQMRRRACSRKCSIKSQTESADGWACERAHPRVHTIFCTHKRSQMRAKAILLVKRKRFSQFAQMHTQPLAPAHAGAHKDAEAQTQSSRPCTVRGEGGLKAELIARVDRSQRKLAGFGDEA
eukprot:6186790-Pleurochrysis_carterae.AAC.2